MKLNFKNVFLSVGIFVFALGVFGLVGTSKAEAFTRTASVTGNWADTVTWGGNSIPTVSDDVIINGNVVVTINTAGAVANTITIADPIATGNNGITIASPGTLSLTGGATGAITITGSSGASDSTIDVADGSLSAKAIAINDGAGAGGVSTLTVSTGSITTSGTGISFGGTGTVAERLLSISSTGTLTLGGTTGTLGANANATDVTFAATSTVAFTGAAQTVPVYTYGHLTLGGTGAKTLTGVTTVAGNFAMSGTVTASPAFTGNIAGSVSLSDTAVMTTGANMTIGTTLTVGTGATLTLAAYSLGVGGASSITGTVNTSGAATGTKTFTGLVTVNSGGAFSLTTVDPETVFSAGITNNSATLMNMGSGISTLVGDLGGTGAITWEGVLDVLSGTTTNNNTSTVTVTGVLTLTGAWTQAANSTLSLGGATNPITGAGVLTTTAVNTVIYSTGIQTIFAPAAGYYNLTLSGTGAKSLPAATDVNNILTVSTSAAKITLLTSSTSTINKLYFGTAYQKKGTWGATAATATHESDTYFTAGVTYHMTVALGHTATVQQDETTITTYPATTTGTTATTTVEATTVAEVVPGCSAGNLFNTSTGAACVNNAVVPQGCSGGNLFNTSTGAACTNNTGITSEKKVYELGTVTLKNGSKGEAVKELQRFLNDKLSLGLVVDGKLGPKTIAVIKTWQTANGLVSDGLVGAKTKAMMNK